VAELTYPEVGGTAREPLPDGYHHVRVTRSLGVVDLDEVAEILFSWRVQERSGVRRISGPDRVALGADVTFRSLMQTIPCRVVEVVDEQQRRGFAYGTLPGHPETGEERFVAERDPESGEVTATITAFSNPATWVTRLGGPVARLVQRVMSRRYLDAMVP
jgi:uncharacterized protein (UPF0548 family)